MGAVVDAVRPWFDLRPGDLANAGASGGRCTRARAAADGGAGGGAGRLGGLLRASVCHSCGPSKLCMRKLQAELQSQTHSKAMRSTIGQGGAGRPQAAADGGLGTGAARPTQWPCTLLICLTFLGSTQPTGRRPSPRRAIGYCSLAGAPTPPARSFWTCIHRPAYPLELQTESRSATPGMAPTPSLLASLPSPQAASLVALTPGRGPPLPPQRPHPALPVGAAATPGSGCRAWQPAVAAHLSP